MKNYFQQKTFFLLITAFCCTGVLAQTFNWNKQVGGTATEMGRSIIVDGAGNTYTTGWFAGTVDFDPGSGITSRTSAGNEDFYLLKLNSSGIFQWVITGGAAGSDYSYEVDQDVSGNLIITGRFVTTVDFDPGAGVASLTSFGSGDIFVAKYSSAGAYIWSKQMGGTSDEYGLSLTVDGAGNIFTTGHFNGTADFNPGPVTNNITSAGSRDIFVSKLDGNGTYLWAKSVGGSMDEAANDMTSDATGNIYLTGYFQGTVDFDPNAGTTSMTAVGMAGFRDIFVMKLTNAGNLSWAAQLGGSTDEAGNSIALDNANNVYTTGYFNSTVDFDPGSGVSNLTSISLRDVYVSKLDNNGNYLWAQQMGGSGDQEGLSIAVNSYGNVGVTGTFTNTVDFDPGPGTSNLTSAGNTDLFSCGLSGSGVYLSAFRIGGVWPEGHIALTSSNCEIYYTGQFQNTVDFNPGTPVVNFTTNGAYDVFVLKMQYDFAGVMSASSCTPYTSPSGNHVWTSTGTYTDTVSTVFGCDSILTVNLTMLSSSTSVDNVTACDSYVWMDGNLYTSNNNTAVHYTTNAAGCDSIITLNLVITNSSSFTQVVSACDSYVWIDGNTYSSNNSTATHVIPNSEGCDSTITLNLTISTSTSGTDVITACDTYTWIDGITYTSSNSVATHLLTNAAGCDSVVTLNLTINSIDTALTQSGNTLTSATSGATYQWIDCATNLPIPGATSQSYTSLVTGSFAVIVSMPGCSDDTSGCHSILLGIENLNQTDLFSIYPNPGTGIFTIQRASNSPEQFSITALDGSLVKAGQFIGNTNQLDLTSYEAGIYFLNVGNHIYKIVKY